jgi:NAD(P)H-flavin reductase
MTHVTFRGEKIELLPNESVLEGLERHGLAPSWSCRAGHCQSCLMQACVGAVPSVAKASLKPSWREQGYFLPCVCVPKEDLEIVEVGDAVGQVSARLVERWQVAPDVAVLRFVAEGPFDFRPGQFVHVVRPADGLSRSYSVASTADSGHIELHVREMPGGQLSPWLIHGLELGQTVELRGPLGSCFYTEESLDQPLVLVGTSTGLAPLLGVLRSALAAGHTGPIRLFHGASHVNGLYGSDWLWALSEAHPNVQVTRSALEGSQEGVTSTSLEELVFGDKASFKGVRVFLCGAPGFVQTFKKRAFLAGAKLTDIYADAFAPPASSN